MQSGAQRSSSSKLERLQADATPAATQASHILKTYVYLVFPLVHLFARAALATEVYSIKAKMAGKTPWQRCWCCDPLRAEGWFREDGRLAYQGQLAWEMWSMLQAWTRFPCNYDG